jgi:trehalose 6-phosphate synthase
MTTGSLWARARAAPPGSSRRRGAPSASVLLVHDLSFLDARREATPATCSWGCSSSCRVGAALVTVLAARLAWRGWTLELQRALSGGAPGPSHEFQPLVRDVRSLVERLAREREGEARAGPWSPERLRSTLRSHLQGERVVDAREPRALHPRERAARASEVLHPASGLVTALEPVMRACSGVWVAHGSGSADRRRRTPRAASASRPARSPTLVRRVWLSDRRGERATTTASRTRASGRSATSRTRGRVFRASDWEHYVRVNRSSPTPCARRSTPTIRSCSCRTTTSPSRRR